MATLGARRGAAERHRRACSNDFEAPVVRTRDVPLTLAGGAASLQAADIDGGSSDNWGIESLSASQTTFSWADIGVRKVVLSAIDKAGLSASGEASVNVIGRVPQPAIAASLNAITLGYGPLNVTLTASDAGAGTTLTWMPAAGLSANGSVASFAPTAAGS